MVVLTDEQRQDVLDELDHEHILDLAEIVKQQLAANRAVEACYMPGDGTYYALVFVPLPNPAGARGGGTGGWPAHTFFHGAHVLVVYAQRETIVAFGEGDSPELAAAELTDNPASAVAIAELLKAVF